jgi:hypothetical protein
MIVIRLLVSFFVAQLLAGIAAQAGWTFTGTLLDEAAHVFQPGREYNFGPESFMIAGTIWIYALVFGFYWVWSAKMWRRASGAAEGEGGVRV